MFTRSRRKREALAVQAYHRQHPDWEMGPRSEAEISRFLSGHPAWSAVSAELRQELSHRLSHSHLYFRSFDAAGALPVVVHMALMFDVMRQNIVPVDRDDDLDVNDKLWMMSETFRRLGSRLVREAQDQAPTSEQEFHVKMVNSQMCTEAAIVSDYYRIDALAQLAYIISFQNDPRSALPILEEAEQWRNECQELKPHQMSKFDRIALGLEAPTPDCAFVSALDDELLTLTREQIEARIRSRG